MATTKSGILYGLSGKVGPVTVSSTSNEVSIVRIMPDKTTHEPQPSQLNQREIFKTVMSFVIQTQQVMRIGYKDYYGTEKPLNAATGYHMKNALKGVYPNYEIDLTKVMVSRNEGGLNEEFSASAISKAGGILNVLWDPAAVYNPYELLKRKMDKAMLLIYDETKGISYTSVGEVTRDSGELTVNLPKVFTGDQLHSYFFFAAVDGKVSNSQYLGSTTALA